MKNALANSLAQKVEHKLKRSNLTVRDMDEDERIFEEYRPAEEILQPYTSEYYINMIPTTEDEERLEKFMMYLLDEKPIFETDKRLHNMFEDYEFSRLSSDGKEESYWRKDRYKLFEPSYDASWNSQHFIAHFDLCYAIEKGKLIEV